MSERIRRIRAMLAKNPRDVFLQYGLGMECAGEGHFEQAVEAFRKCMELDENYLPAYVEAGKCLRSAGKLAEAREAFAAGMERAALRGEKHTRDFIQQQLDSIPPDDR